MSINKHFQASISSRKSLLGVTLIELMISLSIGLVLIAGIGYVYVGSRQSFRTQDALSRMQENARYAFETMGRDIRMAGFRGCSTNITDTNVLANKADWDKNLFVKPLAGYDVILPITTPSTASPAYPAGVAGNALRGDALTVLRADNTKEFIVSSHDTATSTITLTANHDLKQGEILVASDCTHNAVFQMTNSVTGSAIVQHAAGTGNSVAPLGNPSGTPYAYSAGSRLMRLSGVTYYIRSNPAGDPALYQQKLGASGGAPVTTAEEVIDGVEDMQITYALDTTADNDIDSYVESNVIDDVAINWSQVLGMRISLLMVSRQDEQGITAQAQTYNYDANSDGVAESITANDRLLRKVFTTTIAIRNRL